MVKLLLEYNAETDILIPTGSLVDMPPISFAVETCNLPLVALLLNYISPNDDEYLDFGNPIARAIQGNDAVMVEFLLNNGTIDRNLPWRVESLLGEAATLGHLECIHALISNGESINEYDGKGRTALARALKSASDSFIIDFMKYEPEIDLLCLKLAVRRSTTLAVRLLLGQTPLWMWNLALHEAARIGSLKFVRFLLKYDGINPNAFAGSTGELALHAAASNGKTKAVATLLRAGAEVNPRCDRRGETVL